ncbi:MAG TPA: hypothetical protein VNQ73_17555 [Ilumatobacter sp.]|nr:hypothetical protein [Ilumatobacter sp.]
MTILPSPPVVAVVQHDHPPLRPPSRLAAFVTPMMVQGALADWRATDDMVAFADPGVIAQYAAWRATWEQTFELDSLASLHRLTSVAGEFDGAAAAPLAELAAADFETVVEPARLAELVAALATVAAAVRHRGRSGFGVVDATPGSRRVGLVVAWSPDASPAATPEVLAADQYLAAELAADGVRLVPAGSAPLDAVAEVAVGERLVRVTHAAGTAEIAAEHGRPLAWLVPGAALWRVREVPEVVVWARTLAGVEAAARAAGALGLPVRFSCT